VIGVPFVAARALLRPAARDGFGERVTAAGTTSSKVSTFATPFVLSPSSSSTNVPWLGAVEREAEVLRVVGGGVLHDDDLPCRSVAKFQALALEVKTVSRMSHCGRAGGVDLLSY
jgi:hypothetical protein